MPVVQRLTLEVEAEQQEKEKIEAEQAKVRAQYRAKWLAEHGTEAQKAREAEGLLPNGEYVSSLKEWAFTQYSTDIVEYSWKDYKPSCSCDYDTCDCKHEVEDSHSLTEAEYQNLQKIRTVFASTDAKIVPRTHTVTRKECEETQKSNAAKVKLQIGGYEFTRSFVL